MYGSTNRPGQNNGQREGQTGRGSQGDRSGGADSQRRRGRGGHLTSGGPRDDFRFKSVNSHRAGSPSNSFSDRNHRAYHSSEGWASLHSGSASIHSLNRDSSAYGSSQHQRNREFPQAPLSDLPPWIECLNEELDQHLMIQLRDGRLLYGVLRSFDHFGNLMLEGCQQRYSTSPLSEEDVKDLHSDDRAKDQSERVRKSLHSIAESHDRNQSESLPLNGNVKQKFVYFADVALGCMIIRGENIAMFGRLKTSASTDSSMSVERAHDELAYEYEEVSRMNHQDHLDVVAREQKASNILPVGHTASEGSHVPSAASSHAIEQVHTPKKAQIVNKRRPLPEVLQILRKSQHKKKDRRADEGILWWDFGLMEEG